jgi:carbon monoxide dehydrogenase subunit G
VASSGPYQLQGVPLVAETFYAVAFRSRSPESKMRTTAILWLCAVASWAMLAAVSLAGDRDIDVQVRKERSAYEINLEFTVPATIEQTWNVLADYEHMAQIVSNIDSSRIVSRDGNRLTVAQTSHGKVGPLHVSVDGVREIMLTPFSEIRSHLVKGDLKASDFTTSLHAEGPATRVTVSGRLVAAAWVSWALSAETVAAQTRRQYQELRNEILRRKAH